MRTQILTKEQNEPIIIYIILLTRRNAVGFLSLNKDWLEHGFTTLSNRFVLEYLPNTSNADYIKVYLYGLMYAQMGNPELSSKQIADALGFTEEEVIKAFRFWERRKLVVRLQDKPLRYEYVPCALSAQYSNQEISNLYQELNDVLYSLFGEKRLLHGSEISLVQEWIEDLDIPLEVVMIFLQYMINLKGYHFTFHSANKEIVKMKESGASGIEEVEAYLSTEQEYTLGAKGVLNRFRNYRNPTQDEIALYRKWRKEKNLTHDDIMEACKETTKGNASFAYLDGIINGLISRSEKNQSLKELIQTDEEETAEVKKILSALGMAAAKRNITTGIKNTVRTLVENYDTELILYVCNGIAMRGGKLSDLAQELEFLKKDNIITVPSAKAFYEANSNADKLLRNIYDTLALQREPNSNDRKQLLQWQTDFGFGDEIILKCAEFASGKKLPFPYMQKILESWFTRGYDSIEKINEAQERFQETRSTEKESAAAPKGKRVSHQDYQQRKYEEQDYNMWKPDFGNGETT